VARKQGISQKAGVCNGPKWKVHQKKKWLRRFPNNSTFKQEQTKTVLTSMAMDNSPFMDDVTIKTSIDKEFPSQPRLIV